MTSGHPFSQKLTANLTFKYEAPVLSKTGFFVLAISARRGILFISAEVTQYFKTALKILLNLHQKGVDEINSFFFKQYL